MVKILIIIVLIVISFLNITTYAAKVRCGIGFCETQPGACKKYDGCVNNKGCVYSPKICNSQDVCSIAVGCNSTADECLFEPMLCDDEIPCTENSCDPKEGCVFKPNDSLCEDNNACTINTCSTENGCQTLPVACPPSKLLNLGFFGLICYPQICVSSNGGCEKDPNASYLPWFACY